MINRVILRANEYLSSDGTSRRINQIGIHTADMWFYKDINCQRDISLAQRLAKDFGVDIENQLPDDFMEFLK